LVKSLPRKALSSKPYTTKKKRRRRKRRKRRRRRRRKSRPLAQGFSLSLLPSCHDVNCSALTHPPDHDGLKL
jgi:hypothetical protein